MGEDIATELKVKTGCFGDSGQHGGGDSSSSLLLTWPGFSFPEKRTWLACRLQGNALMQKHLRSAISESCCFIRYFVQIFTNGSFVYSIFRIESANLGNVRL